MARGAAIRGPALAHALVALALWPVPLLGMLHAEGAAVTAFASFFIAGVSASGAFARGEGAGRVARRHLALLGIPLVLLSATMLWRPNCGLALGFGLFALLVPPSVLLAVGLADVVRAFRVPRPRTVLVGLGVLLAAVPTVVLLKTRPQLFVYNPVFGGVLGPLYDVELAVRPGLIAHQVAVVVAALGLIALARWKRHGSAEAGRVAMACGTVIAVSMAFSTPLGITQSEAHLRRALEGEVTSERVTIHYEPGTITTARLGALLDEAEFRLWQLDQALGLAPSERVHVYLYPDAEAKAALIGSRETSVVPVWLPTPQVHLLDERADGDLGHELVHVVAREAGGAVTGATWKVGLVEGLAVALEAPEGRPSPEQQAAASLTLPPEKGGIEDPVASIVGAMDPFGFWTGRAGAAYSTTGAFTRWLLDLRGPDPLLAVYGGASWREAYGESLGTLAAAWADDLRSVEVTPEAVEFATWRFGVPSLFEVRCPHHVPRWQRRLREGDDAWDEGRIADAAGSFAASALATEDSIPRLLALSSHDLAVALGALDAPGLPDPEPYLAADTSGTLAAPRLLLAHARRLRGEDAASDYRDALDALPSYSHTQRALIGHLVSLSRNALRAALAPARDSTEAARLGDALEPRDPLMAALRYSQAGDDRRAWDAASRAMRTEEDPSLVYLAARLAYRAGDLAASDSLSAISARRFLLEGLQAPARLAFDLRERIAWRRSLER